MFCFFNVFIFKYTIYENMQKKKYTGTFNGLWFFLEVYDVNATKLSLYYYSVICHLCPRCNVTAAADWHVVSLVISCRHTPSNSGKLPHALTSLYVERAAGWTLSLSIDTPMIHQWVTTGLSHTTELVVVYSTEFFFKCISYQSIPILSLFQRWTCAVSPSIHAYPLKEA